jgi:glycosyltransferase involved in cell wall biosynthesis
MTISPAAMAAAVAPTIKRLRADGFDFDVIDAHYFYPDGIAAAKLARRFDKPLVITARGTDINVIADFARPRRQIKAAAASAGALVTVSQALHNKLLALGIAEGKITTVRNGVDLNRFACVARTVARKRLGLPAEGVLWLSVGNLVEGKGVHVTIQALREVPEVTLLIVGSGPEEKSLRALTHRLGVSGRVQFVGPVAHDRMNLHYSAADVLVFPTRSEGLPNVLLEALACGTAIIASAVGGIPEVIKGLPAGVLLSERTAAAICQAWDMICKREDKALDRESRQDIARQFSWAETARGQIRIFERLTQSQSRLAVMGSDG